MSKSREDEYAQPEVLPTHAIEMMERASIDVQIATARRYPRALKAVKGQILDLATLDEETAEQCFYSLPRGGKTISGPSVRLAEIAVSCYQHLRAGARVIDNDGKSVTAQGVCHDLQNNVCIVMETKRRITKKDGSTFDEDMQIVAGNAAAAIAFRNAVFKVIPSALIKPAYDAARAIAIGTQKTLKERQARCMDQFSKLGVDPDRVCALVGKLTVDEIGLTEIEILIGAFNSIRQGDATIEQIFAESDLAREGAVKAKKQREMADWLVKTEGMGFDEAMRVATERLSETPEQRAERVEREHAAKQEAPKPKRERREPTVRQNPNRTYASEQAIRDCGEWGTHGDAPIWIGTEEFRWNGLAYVKVPAREEGK